MDIKDFVLITLQQIETALIEASAASTQSTYLFDVTSSKGVHFNLAVTNAVTKESATGKKGGLQIKVVEAKLENDKKESTSSESVSRIEFNVKTFPKAKQSFQAL